VNQQAKTVKVKEAVRNNFEQSPDYYQSFEDRFGFFGGLNRRLTAGMSFGPEPLILDIGCGTGASCGQMLEVEPTARVWGLDISGAMLRIAKDRFSACDRAQFVEGDAATLPKYFDFQFDAIIYSASIFLIPDYQESLKQAAKLLKQEGMIGLTFMDGVYDADNRNLLALADEIVHEGISLKKPVKLAEFNEFFSGVFPERKTWDENIEASVDILREFFSIPAMSAGLFPGIPYPERVCKVNKIFDNLPDSEPLFRWAMTVGRKR
jgi:ubiquinone/menaquinone biosynthesis C-methylase UbiE